MGPGVRRLSRIRSGWTPNPDSYCARMEKWQHRALTLVSWEHAMPSRHSPLLEKVLGVEVKGRAQELVPLKEEWVSPVAAEDWEGPGLASPTPVDSFRGILLSPLRGQGQ